MKKQCLLFSTFCFFGMSGIESSEIQERGSISSARSHVSTDWERMAGEAADSYEISYEAFIKEADQFLMKFKKEHPGTNYPNSLEDLVVFKKPDYSDMIRMIDKFNEGKSEDERIDINLFIVPAPKFSVPMRD